MIKKILLIFSLFISCKKESDFLDFNGDYLNVTDVVMYCRGSCNDDTLDWENKYIKVKGYLNKKRSVYYENGYFSIKDIRNNYALSIHHSPDNILLKDSIEKIFSNLDIFQDVIYINGYPKAGFIEAEDCLRELLYLEIKSINDINIKRN